MALNANNEKDNEKYNDIYAVNCNTNGTITVQSTSAPYYTMSANNLRAFFV